MCSVYLISGCVDGLQHSSYKYFHFITPYTEDLQYFLGRSSDLVSFHLNSFCERESSVSFTQSVRTPVSRISEWVV